MRRVSACRASERTQFSSSPMSSMREDKTWALQDSKLEDKGNAVEKGMRREGKIKRQRKGSECMKSFLLLAKWLLTFISRSFSMFETYCIANTTTTAASNSSNPFFRKHSQLRAFLSFPFSLFPCSSFLILAPDLIASEIASSCVAIAARPRGSLFFLIPFPSLPFFLTLFSSIYRSLPDCP